MIRVRDPGEPQPPPAKFPGNSNLTNVESLSEGLLLAIFARLPSLAALIRAALTCRAWRRAVASSPAFRRRFREVHAAPLLGFFFETPGVVETPAVPAFPSFTPVRRGDRDLTAAVRGGDFFLTSIEERPGGPHGWDVLDCRGGYVLLVSYEEELLVVFNPLARRSERFFRRCHPETLRDHRGHAVECDARLLYSDEDPTSFRVVLLAHDESRVRATVFSSDTGEWSIHPWVDVPARLSAEVFWLVDKSMHSGDGCLHWLYKNRKHMITLNTSTMEFSVDKLPRFLRKFRRDHCSLAVGETNSGARCIVYAVEFQVGLLSRTTESDGTGRWTPQWSVHLETQLNQALGKLVDDYNMLRVVAVRDGFAYLATSQNYHEVSNPSWFLSFCLETWKLEKLFQRANDSYMHPYFIAWPPCLVGNRGRFALEGGRT